MVLSLKNLNYQTLVQAITTGVKSRILSIVIVALICSLGILPAALSTGMGSEIQKPLAIMTVEGLIYYFILSFTVLQVILNSAYSKR